MVFTTHVYGFVCLCEVTHYTPAKPMLITGSGYGDALPPEDAEFEFRILDKDTNRPSPWLQRHCTPEVEQRLLKEFHARPDMEEPDA